MPYELRVPGRDARRFDTEAEGEAAARALILSDPDIAVELIDLATGRPCGPGASAADRAELAKRVGF